MNSLILRTSARLLLPALILFSVLVMLRGHNDPGGGFIGGLIAAAGFALHALANGREAALATLRIEPIALLGIGLLVATASGIAGIVAASPFLTHQWLLIELGPVTVPLGTALPFDIGVYLVVLGAVTTFLFEFMER